MDGITFLFVCLFVCVFEIAPSRSLSLPPSLSFSPSLFFSRCAPVDRPWTLIHQHTTPTTHVRRTSDAVRAVVVLDVVEGTAMASLSHIQMVVNSRPAQFASVNQVV
jgi:hypothetical protein